MTVRVTDVGELARTAPVAARGTRPMTTYREDMISMVLAFWVIIALFFDARNHNNKTGQESFFSLAHLILYTGLTVFGLWVAHVVVSYQRRAGADLASLKVDLSAIPVGYGVTLIGLGILGIGGPADLAWHSAYGFEVNIEAIVSPPHLCLFFGGFLVASTGIRSMWAKPDLQLDLRGYAPVLLSAILFTAVAGFITMYLSAFNTLVGMTKDFTDDVSANFNDVVAHQDISMNAGLTGYGDKLWPYHYFSTGQVLASLIITNFVLLGPALLLLRRWRTPFPSFAITFLVYGLLTSIMTSYNDPWLLIPLVVTGLTLDVLQQKLPSGADGRLTLGSIRAVGPVGAAVLWVSYFIVVDIDKGIGWGATTLIGTVMIAVMGGFGVSFLIAPPAYGPRLVEGDEGSQIAAQAP
jgi:hypothetical protein